MTYFTEKGRPPDEPPDEPPRMRQSWASKVSGMSAGGGLTPEAVLDEEFVASRLNVEFPHGEDGEPVITIGNEVLEAMNGLWKNCMIVKILGRHVPIMVLNRKLKEMWNPRGSMYVLDLPRQFFMVRFGEEDDYLKALTGGPWRAFGSYLMVQAWSPEFDPMSDDIVTTPVFVRLSNLPINFYHKAILLGIARSLDKPIRVDATTLNLERARFARVCVEVNLSKPLKGSVVINGGRYFVSYEGLTNICAKCGVYGHSIHKCPQGALVQSGGDLVQSKVVTSNQGRESEDGIRPARRPNRRTSQTPPPVVFQAGGSGENLGRNLKEITRVADMENIITSNSFGNLAEETTGLEVRDAEISLVEDKENQIISLSSELGKEIPGDRSEKSRGKEGPKEIGRGKKTHNNISNGTSGPKARNKQQRPMRGLIFGPPQASADLSITGKRLRVERDCVGRPGGVFVKGRDDEVGMERRKDGSSAGSDLVDFGLEGNPNRNEPTNVAKEACSGMKVVPA